jgi:hypothetical protein
LRLPLCQLLTLSRDAGTVEVVEFRAVAEVAAAPRSVAAEAAVVSAAA